VTTPPTHKERRRKHERKEKRNLTKLPTRLNYRKQNYTKDYKL
jgi:hypothetical protein